MNFFAMVTTRASSAYTLYALDSFFANTPLPPGDEFFLIDNDGEYAPLTPPQARVNLIRNPTPLGFAANVNQIMRLASAKHADLFFLNNDIIITPDWLPPLCAPTPAPAIISPLSNQQLQHRSGKFHCRTSLELSEFIGHESALVEIAREQRRRGAGFHRDFHIYFFAIKIPHAVYSVIGPLDETFGPGGGEDADYCLRCHLANIPVLFAMQSYVLHFAGKSTWSGPESPAARLHREQNYQQAFIRKWGQNLFDVTIRGNGDALHADPQLLQAFNRGDYRFVVETLRIQ
jgi:GT2 family glycosyltransferase